MKYILIFFFCVIMLSDNGNAQNFKATYLQVLNLNDKPDTLQAVLIFNRNESIYNYGKTENGYKFKSGPGRSDEETTISASLSDADGFSYYKNFGGKVFINRELLFTAPKLITDSVPIIDWVISDTGKKIAGSLNCKKATGNFRGRTYIVWFTPDIPVVTGPWKLYGLPGLIVEARDTEGQVSYQLLSLSQTNETINIPVAPQKMTQYEFAKAFKQKTIDLAKYLKSSVQAGSGFETKATVKINTLERSLFNN